MSQISTWQANNAPILVKAMNEKREVTILLTRGFDEHSQPLLLQGYISNTQNNVANFVVESSKPATHQEIDDMMLICGTTKNLSKPIAMMTFTMALQMNGLYEPTKYSGEVSIVKLFRQEQTRDVYAMFVHAALPLRVRRIRNDPYFAWNETIPSTVGLESLNIAPQTKLQLRDVLSHIAQSPLVRPSIVEISASGVCLKTDWKYVKMPMQTIFFFLLTLRHELSPISFFMLCRKLGLTQSQGTENNSVLRFHFLQELNYARSSTNLLVWNNIEKTGSDSLRTQLRTLFHSPDESEELPLLS